jgi:hypothetical protein
MRQVIVIVVAAGLIGYDLIMLNGYYARIVIAEASAIWSSIESFFFGLL